MHLAITEAGNTLLERDPLALLIGMLLDQQIPMEKAFTSPSVLRDRLGHDLDAVDIASHDATAFEELFRTPPALHRFPAAMAKRVQALCTTLVDQFDGRAETVWTGAADGPDLVKRIGRLPGFGDQKARIFAALLGKQFDVRPRGWREATGAYGENGSFRSVADVIDDASLQKVRTFKKAQKRANAATSAG
ncbi:MAG: HhH-GPD-type base excision DNA repair protein [Jatrophihabitantaceae bacterium]